MKYTRDQIEKFLNDNADTALDSIKQDPRPLSKWITDFSRILTKLALEEAGVDEDDDDSEDSVFGDSEPGGLFDDPEEF